MVNKIMREFTSCGKHLKVHQSMTPKVKKRSLMSQKGRLPGNSAGSIAINETQLAAMHVSTQWPTGNVGKGCNMEGVSAAEVSHTIAMC
jgi:hypothetical protein